MQRRFVSIWFRYLKTDWFVRRQPGLANIPFVLACPRHGRMLITAANALAEKEGAYTGMALADARALVPGLQVFDDQEAYSATLLSNLAVWFTRYTPVAAVNLPDGILLDATGCAHLWGGEKEYLTAIYKRLSALGYQVKMAMADTVGAAWAVARFGRELVVETGQQAAALQPLPPVALRLEISLVEKLEKLGLFQVRDFICMPSTALRRRFGSGILQRIHQALGLEEEWLIPVQAPEPYCERLPCIEPIVTAAGISIALQQLLQMICERLKKEGSGVRMAVLQAYRVDGKVEAIGIGTNSATCNVAHLYKLFQLKIENIQPASGIELFVLEVKKTGMLLTAQEKLWHTGTGLQQVDLTELIDRIEGKMGAGIVHRYLSQDHYWPEHSFKQAISMDEAVASPWKRGRPRPLQILFKPQLVEVTAPVPDYPPMLFRYQGKLHKIIKADGPERIEQEWWLQQGHHRDYYIVEDEAGKRYWLFRSGHYGQPAGSRWFIHGFFS